MTKKLMKRLKTLKVIKDNAKVLNKHRLLNEETMELKLNTFEIIIARAKSKDDRYLKNKTNNDIYRLDDNEIYGEAINLKIIAVIDYREYLFEDCKRYYLVQNMGSNNIAAMDNDEEIIINCDGAITKISEEALSNICLDNKIGRILNNGIMRWNKELEDLHPLELIYAIREGQKTFKNKSFKSLLRFEPNNYDKVYYFTESKFTDRSWN